MKAKLAYVVPRSQYQFFDEMIPELEGRGFEVHRNPDPESLSSFDLVLLAMLPQTPEWIPFLRSAKTSYILWHWDLFSFVDLGRSNWAGFLHLLKRCTDVWSCSYEVARQLKEVEGLESFMVPAWVDQRNFVCSCSTQDYAMYAGGCKSIGKRVEWAEEACKLLGYRVRINRQNDYTREEYFRVLAGCRVYLMPAFEESNGTIPAMEAMAMGKPVVCADIPSNREVFGCHAHYFNNWDFGHLLKVFKVAWWEAKPSSPGAERILGLYSLSRIADLMAERLHYVAASRKSGGIPGRPW